MKSKKLKLLKLCGLLTGALMIGTIPIITTSCGEKSQSGDNNQTPSKPGGDSSGGDQSGGGTSGGSGTGDTQTKKVPKLKESLTTNIKYTDVYSGGAVKIDETLAKYFQDKTNIKNALSNGKDFNDDELSKTTLTLLDKYDNEIKTKNTWGSKEYSSWISQSKSTYSYQPETSLQVDISKSVKDILKDETTLKNVATSSGIDLSGNKTISLNETNKPKLDENTFNVCVDITTPQSGRSGPTTESDLLEIPLSSLTLNLNSANVEIKSSATSVQEDTKSTVNVVLDVLTNSSPIDSENAFKNGFVLKDATETVNEASFIKDLDLSVPAVANRNSVVNALDSKTEQNLNSRKLSDMFKIYNVDFSNLKIVSKSDEKTPGQEGYTGLFVITIDATPRKGYFWDDKGNSEKKTLTQDNVSIKLRLSDWVDGTSGIESDSAKQYTEKIAIGKEVNQENVDAYFKKPDNFKAFLDAYLKKNTKTFTNCDFFFKNIKKADGNNADLAITIKPKMGLEFKSSKKDVKEKDISIKLTNVVQQ